MKILHYNNYKSDVIDKNIPFPWNTHFYFTIEDLNNVYPRYKFYIIADDWEKQIKYQCKNKCRYLNKEASFKFEKVNISPNLYNPFSSVTNTLWLGVYKVLDGTFYVSQKYEGKMSIVDWIADKLKGNENL